MAASGILLCGIAGAVRPEADFSAGVAADKVVIADGILNRGTQKDTDESFCDRLMKKMVHPIHTASRFLNGLGADSEEYVPSETEYNLMALRTEESAVDLSDPLAAFESLPWYKLAKRFRSMGTEDTWGAKMYEALGTRDAQWISERSTGGFRRHRSQPPRKWSCQLRRYSAAMIPPIQSITRRTRRAGWFQLGKISVSRYATETESRRPWHPIRPIFCPWQMFIHTAWTGKIQTCSMPISISSGPVPTSTT